MTYLLDVNVLMALLDLSHDHHIQARSWFDAIGAESWATCPITENGVMRVLGNPNYRNSFNTVSQIEGKIAQWNALPGHVFWPDDVTLVQNPHVRVDHHLAPN